MVAGSPAAAPVADAYAACLAMARAHYENFPVASWLVPPRMRPHIAAVYAFARVADDYADEGLHPIATREHLIEAWRRRLHAAAEGRPVPDGPHPEVFVALGETMRACALPVDLFDDLLDAFLQDTRVARYGTWDDVLDYCRRSANPVGRLVLRIAGVVDPQADAESDAVCTALQLANFWQDLAIDWGRGRLYVPRDLAERHGAEIGAFDPAHLTPAWREALRECRARTRALFVEGRGVTGRVEGRLRHELRLTWLGGMRILERLDRRSNAAGHERPSLGAADALVLAGRWVSWSGGREAR